MPEQEIQVEVSRLMDKKMGLSEQMQSLTLAMLELDEERFEKTMSKSILQIGFERTMMNLIYPFFQRIGILWQTGAITPAQEHFISCLVRQKIIVAIDGQIVNYDNNSRTYLLYLPENELHEMSLLFSAYIIKARNNKLIYIGQNVPLEDLETIYDAHKPDYLLTVMTSFPASHEVQSYIGNLSDSFKDAKVLITGRQVVGQQYDLPDNIVLLNKLQDLISFCDTDSLPE